MALQAPEFYAADRDAWRSWLEAHHATAKNVWLMYDKKAAGGTLTQAIIAQEALCYGWIDSLPGKVDERRTKVYVSPRKPRSVWSRVNKVFIEQLIADGRMQPAGLAAIERAKQNGSWTAIDDAEALVMPPDLASELAAHPPAAEYFAQFPPGVRRAILQWILSAKRDETRRVRVRRTAELAAQNIRVSQYRSESGGQSGSA